MEVANHRLAGTLLVHLNRKAGSEVVDERNVKAQYDGANSQASLAIRDTKWAVVFGIMGLVVFVLGALVGGLTLIMFSGGTP